MTMRVIPIVLIVLSLMLCLHISNVTRAAFAASSALDLMAAPEFGENPALLGPAISEMEESVRLDPRNPTYQHRLGRLYFLQYFQNRLVAKDGLDKAVVALRKSLDIRAEWPLAWIHLAMTKSAMNQYDDEFVKGLNKFVALFHQVSSADNDLLVFVMRHWPYIKDASQLDHLISIFLQHSYAPTRMRNYGVLKNYAEIVRIDKESEVGRLIRSENWRHENPAIFTSVVADFWKRWGSQERQTLIAQVAEVVNLDEKPQRHLRKYDSVALRIQLCPHLQRKPILQNYCLASGR